VTLAEMTPGQTGHIHTIQAGKPSVIRLMVLGLVEDVPLRIENIAIGGDPIEVSLFGSSISIRKQDAQMFEVILDGRNG
jgi:Fe2+ transport system protein FeoA